VVLTGAEDGGAAGNLEVNTGELGVGFHAAAARLALCSRGGGTREAARGGAAGGGRAGPASPFMGTRARRQRRPWPGRPWRLWTLWPVGPDGLRPGHDRAGGDGWDQVGLTACAWAKLKKRTAQGVRGAPADFGLMGQKQMWAEKDERKR
jgi:hypothetical protein